MRHDIDKQRPLIHDFTKNEEFLLVILDACRYEIFEDIYTDYIDGDLTMVWASGRWTGDYARRTWTGDHDLTYLTPMPVISDFYYDIRGRDYRPEDHIDHLVPLWDTDWDPNLGTVPPSRVTDAALAYANNSQSTRLVAHYSQPHAPYIGDTEILPWDGELEGMRELLKKDIDRPTQRIYSHIENGEISDQRLREAYIDNLKYALDEVVRLIRQVDCPVVITGDHGEHLGENGKYLHEEESTLIRQVPWLVVDDSEIGKQDIELEYSDHEVRTAQQDRASDEIKERLADLGYTDPQGANTPQQDSEPVETR